MKYRTSVAFRTALEARLKATQSGTVGLARLRKRVVFERLLARLLAVAPVQVPAVAIEQHIAEKADEDLRTGHAKAASLLNPILARELTSGRWHPETGEWRDA